MHTINAIFKRYTAWIWHVLAPLGPWGVLAIAAVDASFMGLPMDAVVAGYVYHEPHRFLLYVLLASAGSALGSSVLYVIGYLGGETVLRKRLSEERYAKIHASFEKHEFWALMFPAMLPPPTPFKLFVLGAAIFEMRFTHFLAAIFAGRFVRFFVLAILTIKFGPQVIQLAADLFRHHLSWVLAAIGVALAVWLVFLRKKRNGGGLHASTAESTE